MKIQIKRNNLYCQIEKKYSELIQKCLEYDSVFYISGQYSKKRKAYKATFWYNRQKGKFLTGLLPRVIQQLDKKKISYEIVDDEFFEVLEKEKEPYLEKLKINEQTKIQLESVKIAIEKQKGIIQLPTGVGKTITALLLMSAYPNSRILFLCHTVDLLYQTKDELEKFGFNNIRIIGNQKNEDYLHLKSCIVVSIDKSFVKQNPENYGTFFDIVIVDECHHVANKNCHFATILNECLAPIKIGLSATPQPEGIKQLTQEGYLGPVITSLSIHNAVSKGMLVPVKLNLVSVPVTASFNEIKSFKQIYNSAIVESNIRNQLIMEEALKFGTCLIMVKELEHGNNILKLFQKIHPEVKIKFVQGNVKGEERIQIKNDLNNKKLDVVIATTVWKEGVNIPTLNHVINACGYKSEIPALQMLGRGSRTAEGKSELILTDFIDCYQLLAVHFAYRITAYKNAGWI